MIDGDGILLSSSAALARLARERDPQAWSALIDRHGAAILRAAGRVTNDAALREDICQETLLQIRAHAGEFRSQGLPNNPHHPQDAEIFARAWVMRIACCTALKMIRTRARSVERETKVPPAQPPVSPAETAVAQEQAEQVRREVAALPETHRDAVSLRFFGECAYIEIAAILRISEEAAKKRVQRGLDLLRARLSAGGVALSAALLMSLLQQGLAGAAEVSITSVAGASAAGASAAGASAAGSNAGSAAGECAVEGLDFSRRAAWQALVNSSQTPALTGVVLSGGVTMVAKAGMGIAAAALLALGIGGGLEIRASRQFAERATASAAEAALQTRALETKLDGNRNEIDVLRRVVESRNSELTSLRDKVAELDKRNVGGLSVTGLGAGLGGGTATGKFFTRTVGDRALTVVGADGKAIPMQDALRIADAITVQANEPGKPGEPITASQHFTIHTIGGQTPAGAVTIQFPQNAAGANGLAPAVLPPPPPLPVPAPAQNNAKAKGEAEGNF